MREERLLFHIFQWDQLQQTQSNLVLGNSDCSFLSPNQERKIKISNENKIKYSIIDLSINISLSLSFYFSIRVSFCFFIVILFFYNKELNRDDVMKLM